MRQGHYIEIETGTMNLPPFGEIPYETRRRVEIKVPHRETCPVCKRSVAVTLDGRLYRHGHTEEVHLNGTRSVMSPPCEGTGERVVTA